MPQVKVQVERLIDESYPIWLEATLVDKDGKEWTLVDKAPVFFTNDVLPSLPTKATVRCSIIKSYFDNSNREVYIITTETPDHIEDKNTGNSEFHVYEEQLIF